MGRPKKINLSKDISINPPEMNESMLDHVHGVNPVIIKQFDCIRDGISCINNEDCEIKDYFDFFLWNCLKLNVTTSVEIRKCHNYLSEEESIVAKTLERL